MTKACTAPLIERRAKLRQESVQTLAIVERRLGPILFTCCNFGMAGSWSAREAIGGTASLQRSDAAPSLMLTRVDTPRPRRHLARLL